ncbi:hypothetical protein IFT84_11200 [Rhizobium sp. CFBP 8762]|uniref:hypothetical protein n=1 Tax=Rhizobium sp. CFBP 8762 TaxID=2775279 RepID=UPI00177B488C|nr:hypothetical protein [Rhizobium sp. CFBP 8762]MBD8555091.1 hypothetical protein [Rhizobium sp. CFBP 8762]
MNIQPAEFVALIIRNVNRPTPLCNIEIRQMFRVAIAMIRSMRAETGIPFLQSELQILSRFEKLSATAHLCPYDTLMTALLDAAEEIRTLAIVIDRLQRRNQTASQ